MTSGLDIIAERHDAASEKTLSSIKEQSRIDFTFSIFDHPKGQWLQFYFKKVIEKFILWAHKIIEKSYDKNAFVFDDKRLQEIWKFASEYCENNLVDKGRGIGTNPNPRRKVVFVMAAVDIFLFFLKEDKAWRAWVLDALNTWDAIHGTGKAPYELTELEKQNLEEW